MYNETYEVINKYQHLIVDIFAMYNETYVGMT